MSAHAVVAAAVLSAAVVQSAAQAEETCTVEVGPGERFEQDHDAVVQAGERLKNVTALRGRVIVKSGAEVDEAMAVGGDLVVEPGGKVRRSATSVGGDVQLRGDAQVGESAVSLGGEVIRSKDARVGGTVVAFSVRVGDRSLSESIERQLATPRCKVVQVAERPAAAAGTGRGTAL
jgi:NDP-sugar pyrophosphorylase family protein